MKNFKLIAMLVIVSLIASCSKDDAPKNSSAPSVLAVTTDTPSAITATEAKLGGNVTSDGGSPVTRRGICIGTTINPIVDGDPNTSITEEIGTGLGAFSDTFNGLPPNTTGHVRAFATNAKGTVYGENKQFTTKPNPQNALVVTTDTPTGITSTSVTLGGNVVSDGGSPVTRRGICVSATVNPTIDDPNVDVLEAGAGLGAFSGNVNGFPANTIVNVRAFATNGTGTAYGENKTFRTLP